MCIYDLTHFHNNLIFLVVQVQRQRLKSHVVFTKNQLFIQVHQGASRQTNERYN